MMRSATSLADNFVQPLAGEVRCPGQTRLLLAVVPSGSTRSSMSLPLFGVIVTRFSVSLPDRPCDAADRPCSNP